MEETFSMKDMISKVTFGFFMAQFFPGAIATSSIILVYYTVSTELPNAIIDALLSTIDVCTATFTQKMGFLGLCTGVGMLIHGRHWSVLGFLESAHLEDGKEEYPKVKTLWNDKRIIHQIFLAPVKLIWEVLKFLFRGRQISVIAIEENVPYVPDEKMSAFQYLQDFYLHFAQFYCHTSYALLLTTVSVVVFCLVKGFTISLTLLFLCSYILTGLLFVIGRIQFTTLFMAEMKLIPRSSAKTDRITKA